MVHQAELKILVERLEQALDQTTEMKLEHLQFLLSLALKEAEQQLSMARVPPRLVIYNTSRG
ncbi:hypothetical protein [Bradyrhizobium sp.]|jgi:hypothetical protein|uniref:hypothetical protein n=1 Tax=Bradyrhizobium sp. TaxID=376 RepID=UPI002DF8F7EE|nr:hypothetical protein [Bradyrhizobium sp.]